MHHLNHQSRHGLVENHLCFVSDQCWIALLCMKLLFFKIFVRVSDSRDAGED